MYSQANPSHICVAMMWFSDFLLTPTISYLEVFLLQNRIGAPFHKSEWGVLTMDSFNCFNPEKELNWIYMRQYRFVSWVDELGVQTGQAKVFRFKMVLTRLAVFCYLEKEVNWNVSSLEILSWNRDIQDAGSTQRPFLLQSIMDACVYSSSHQEAAAQWGARFPLLSHRSQFTSSCLLCFSCSSWWLLPRKFSMSSGPGENTNSQCDETHSLKGTCEQNSLTPRCTEDSITWNLTK